MCIILRIQSESADVIDLTLDSDSESPMKAERYCIQCICAWIIIGKRGIGDKGGRL